MKTFSQQDQQTISPTQALELLKQGNQRFVNKQLASRDLLQQVSDTASGQYPFAVILSCIDSRTSAELIFDQGMGDIFSIRIAGNVLNEDILGSMEFGCQVAGSKLIVVLGHSHCGAIKGACDQVKLGHLTGLLEKVSPAIEGETTTSEPRDSSNTDFVENVTKLHIQQTAKAIIDRSAIIRDMLQKGECAVIGANYDITTGQVEFYDDTLAMNQK